MSTVDSASARSQRSYGFAFSVVAILSLITTWYFSDWTLTVYQFGDLFHYRRFWDAAANLSIQDLFRIQRSVIGSGEPLYGLFVFLFSGIGHQLTINAVNVAVVATLLALCWKERLPVVLLPLILSNFYLLVLLSSAERLKFAFLIIGIGLLLTGWKRAIILSMSPLMHLQSTLILIPIVAYRLFAVTPANVSHPSWLRRIPVLALVLISLSAVLIYSGDVFARKVQGYSAIIDDVPIQSIGVAFFGSWVFRHRKSWVYSLIILAAFATILGGSRMNMISVLTLLAMFAVERRYWNPAFVALCIYLSAKGVIFVQTYAVYGTGWPRPDEYLTLGRY